MQCFSSKCTIYRLYLHFNFTIAHSRLNSKYEPNEINWRENRDSNSKMCHCVGCMSACDYITISLVFFSSAFLCTFWLFTSSWWHFQIFTQLKGNFAAKGKNANVWTFPMLFPFAFRKCNYWTTKHLKFCVNIFQNKNLHSQAKIS